jgi:DNA-directed RNA polymerase II subunit RPB1
MAEEEEKARILGIQFSILSPEEIENMSVAEITSRDTYVNNKPVLNGLFDPRLGVQEPGFICPTDGHDYIKTPGYFGHINLARPVFFIQYLSSVLKILRCICIKCSKLLIDKKQYENLLELPAEARWGKVFQLANKVKTCGECTTNGCGCTQPKTIKKEGLATVIAEWEKTDKEDPNALVMKLTPEFVIKIFKRISDEDVNFMGFSPLWSRPEWMVCSVLPVAPPAVRPSIKHDSQQRSEDDITHIMINIIKANKTLQEKIETNAPANIIDDWTTMLQYYIATLVDNNIPGVASVAQRSGRPLKTLRERLNGKGGRVRGNLMGKRVDFSARSVITPDPNLSIRELGIPLKIAMNITKPVIVNSTNRNFLMSLIQNGPDVYPGAKILEKTSGENISLRYVDRNSVILNNNDIVHRHMMDGDSVLFNRQPTLHRMSMMCHVAKIMKRGDTFRMNVADTKPYNADFDGDEMNLHMPQDVESEMELKHLAAVPYQLISPANNKTIVGIFQDSLIGAYQFTDEKNSFTKRETMNLLMNYNDVNTQELDKIKKKSNPFDILSQITPPISLKFKTSQFEDGEDMATSNNVLEIYNGKMLRGNLVKGVLGDGTKGILHRVCNDYGNIAASNYIDDIQNIVTEFMKTNSYSVGVSDLIANKKTKDTILQKLDDKKTEVNNLIQKTHLGIFENDTAKSNKDEFELQVNNILNQASSQAGKIGRTSLDKENRFVKMVKAGSKGSDLNISQMISCLGQQNVDGKRIPYGFDSRTLPHFNKYDDSPLARGFVENSYIAGLSPEELFFHAMGGRVGLIDTAVKTSQTGYIQRRLIKGCEDLKVEYDMTVRNNKGKITQYKYGDDNIDPCKVEGFNFGLIGKSINEIYDHFNIPYKEKDIIKEIFTSGTITRIGRQKTDCVKKTKEYIDYMIETRDSIVENVFKCKNDNRIHIPIAFDHLIANIKGQHNISQYSMVDVTPLELFDIIEETMNKLETSYYCKPSELFKAAYYYYLSPKNILIRNRFNRDAINVFISKIIMLYQKSIVSPGEMVGMIAAQSIGEPTTQMTLNTFHFAGVASKSNVTRGVPRIEEILTLSENTKNPSLTIHLKKEDESNIERANSIMNMVEYTTLRDIIDYIEIVFDPIKGAHTTSDDTTMSQYYEFERLVQECNNEPETVTESYNWIVRMEMDAKTMLDKNITMDDINYTLKSCYGDEITCVYSDFNSDKLVFRIRLNISPKKKVKLSSLDQSDEIHIIKNFQENLMNNIIIRGVKNIKKVMIRKFTDNMIKQDGKYVEKEKWVLDTDGSNLLDILALDYIDVNKTFTNNIVEIYKVLGIEAARTAIMNELAEVIEFDGTYINYHHMTLLCDRMTNSHKMISIFRHGINNDNIGPIAKASFEETPEMFLKAARHGEVDMMRGVSANVMCGQEAYFGTNSFKVVLNMEELMELHKDVADEDEIQSEDELDDMFGEMDDPNDKCSISNIQINNTGVNIESSGGLGEDDDYDLDF